MNQPDDYTQQCAHADSQAEAAEQARGLTPEQLDAIEIDRGVDAWLQYETENTMSNPNEETPEQIKQHRDALLKIVEGAQKSAKEAQNTIRLLVLAGHVDETRVEQAQELARL